MTTVSRLFTLSRHDSRLFAVVYRIIDRAGQLFREPKVTSREPCPKLVSVPCLSLVRTAIYIDLHRLPLVFAQREPSCLLPLGVEKCADNARAFSGVIKGLNPRSFARSTTLILSTTSSEPATRQAINSCTVFRLHDCLAQISSATMQPFTGVCLVPIKSDVYKLEQILKRILNILIR